MTKTTDQLTPTELRALCDERGVSYRPKDSSSQLRTKLAKSTPVEPLAAASDDPSERLKLAKAEHKLLKAWAADGEKPPRPSTPNLDAMNAEYEARGGKPAPKVRKRTSTTRATGGRPGAGFRFYRNGRPMSDRHNSLSHVAWFAGRVPVADLRSAASAVSSDLLNEPWSVELPSGTTVELRHDSDAAALTTPAAAKSTSKAS